MADLVEIESADGVEAVLREVSLRHHEQERRLEEQAKLLAAAKLEIAGLQAEVELLRKSISQAVRLLQSPAPTAEALHHVADGMPEMPTQVLTIDDTFLSAAPKNPLADSLLL